MDTEKDLHELQVLLVNEDDLDLGGEGVEAAEQVGPGGHGVFDWVDSGLDAVSPFGSNGMAIDGAYVVGLALRELCADLGERLYGAVEAGEELIYVHFVVMLRLSW